MLEALGRRMGLDVDAVGRLDVLRKGFVGEVLFAGALGEGLRSGSGCVVLYDLLLRANGSVFQLDCVVIREGEVLLLEVKNYEGDYVFRDERFYHVGSGQVVKNPLNQLERSEFLLGKVLGRLGFDCSIRARVVFVHPGFMLFQAPLGLPVIYPSQVGRFVRSLNGRGARVSGERWKLARRLFAHQIVEERLDRVPGYDFAGLRKGMCCLDCRGFLVMRGGSWDRVLVCEGCGCLEGRESAVLRSVVEFDLLFPDDAITTRVIWKWCGGVLSMRVVRKILDRFLYPVGGGRYRRFEFGQME